MIRPPPSDSEDEDFYDGFYFADEQNVSIFVYNIYFFILNYK